MFDFLSLVGKEEKKAIEILKNAGFKHIITMQNSKQNSLCDTSIVCNVKFDGNEVKLYVGDFRLEFEER